ncbi:LuxR family transcriptional regulator [Corynebacterium suranareeae]|uniref:LuxR family transcriptional regulator n=1 Tax=Corynebacterium suranareeae TaxID=2506452 RepID=A0A160PSW0_9CORY|nr:response regulator transcription factor [Corynebacterium suranareeae]BAU96836.1 LuxR family transcriptional regulator [Corynebacterium suranareeae]
MISVLIVDDEPLMRAGITLIVESDPTIKVTAEAENGREALEQLTIHNIDVVLLDIRMPVMDGLETLKTISEEVSPPAVIMLTATETDESIVTSLSLGALGFLLKTTPPAALISSIHSAATSQPVLSQEVISNLLELHHVPQPTALDSLSPREHDITRLIARGLTNEEICHQLFLSLSTVKTHIGRIMNKLKVSNRVQIAVTYVNSTRRG